MENDIFAKIWDEKKLERVLKDPEVLLELFQESPTLKAMLGIEQEKMEELYKQGHELYKKESFYEASKYFATLTILDLAVKEYWLSLAVCLFCDQQFQAACKAFEAVEALEAENMHAIYYQARCWQALEDKARMQQALEKALKLADKVNLRKELEKSIRQDFN